MLTRYTACWPNHSSEGRSLPVAPLMIPAPAARAGSARTGAIRAAAPLPGSPKRSALTWNLLQQRLGKVAEQPGEQEGEGEEHHVGHPRGALQRLPRGAHGAVARQGGRAGGQPGGWRGERPHGTAGAMGGLLQSKASCENLAQELKQATNWADPQGAPALQEEAPPGGCGETLSLLSAALRVFKKGSGRCGPPAAGFEELWPL